MLHGGFEYNGRVSQNQPIFHQPESEKNHQLILRFWLNLVIDVETIVPQKNGGVLGSSHAAGQMLIR